MQVVEKIGGNVAPVEQAPAQSAAEIAPAREERLFLLLSIFIGVISGLLVVSFRMAIDWLSVLLLGPSPAAHQPRLIIVPALAGNRSRSTHALRLPTGPRQRGQPDQGGALHLERLHLHPHRHWQVPPLLHRNRERSLTRP